MNRSEVRELLGRWEEMPAPEPDAAFAARLEANLRAMAETPADDLEKRPARRSRRARLVLAAGPVAVLTAAAAAAAVTLLPHDPHPRQVKTADPGIAAPAPLTTGGETTDRETVPGTVASPPWLPPVAAPTPPTPPTTTGAHRPAGAVVEPTAGAGESPVTTGVPTEHEPVTTAPPEVTTTTVPPIETLSLHCSGNGQGAVACTWTQSTSTSFHWYRLYREVPGSNRVLIASSDMRTNTAYTDSSVQAGASYQYRVEATDSTGNVVGRSAAVPVTCC